MNWDGSYPSCELLRFSSPSCWQPSFNPWWFWNTNPNHLQKLDSAYHSHHQEYFVGTHDHPREKPWSVDRVTWWSQPKIYSYLDSPQGFPGISLIKHHEREDIRGVMVGKSTKAQLVTDKRHANQDTVLSTNFPTITPQSDMYTPLKIVVFFNITSSYLFGSTHNPVALRLGRMTSRKLFFEALRSVLPWVTDGRRPGNLFPQGPMAFTRRTWSFTCCDSQYSSWTRTYNGTWLDETFPLIRQRYPSTSLFVHTAWP